jgi:hypothetical protein
MKLNFIFNMERPMRRLLILLPAMLLLSFCVFAQEAPYFVTYDHSMEEPGNLEISTRSNFGVQRNDLPTYWGQLMEFEYGVKGWWSSSLYLEGATAPHDATVFTGYRIENRFKPLKSEHRINPILYFEYENISEASRIQNEIVGHAEPNNESLSHQRGEKEKELEAKLILSSNVKSWNIAENFIVEKNLTEDEGFEFGYALGVNRPLSTLASGRECRFCRENFTAGLELYGGLGSTEAFGFSNTAHYLSPGLMWKLGENSTFKVAPAFGLTNNSSRLLVRVGYTYEISGFGRKVSRMFGGK